MQMYAYGKDYLKKGMPHEEKNAIQCKQKVLDM